MRKMNPRDAKPCEGSGRPWDRRRSRIMMCPVCDAGPATLRVPDDEPAVPDHPNMVVWLDVVAWRTHRAANRDEPVVVTDGAGVDREVVCGGCGDEWPLRPGEDMARCLSCGSRKIMPGV